MASDPNPPTSRRAALRALLVNRVSSSQAPSTALRASSDRSGRDADASHRIRTVVVTAVVVVGVTAASVAALTAGPHRNGPPIGGTSQTLEPSVQVSGTSIPYEGLQPWTSATIPSRDSTSLSVFVVGSTTKGGGPCDPPVLRLLAHETSDEVEITVAAYRQPPSNTGVTACAGVGHIPSPQLVTLHSPLGDRKVVDASTGKRETLVVGSDLPNIPNPPAQLQPQPVMTYPDEQSVVRNWRSGDDIALTLQIQPPAVTRDFGAYGRTVQHADIRGTTATVYDNGGGAAAVTTVQWTPNPLQTISLNLRNSGDKRWTTAEAVAIAQSVTNYTTEATDRVPQPITPGTAAASYNSADGPVSHVGNVLKSSGVYVGVNCEGKGTVTVSLRGASYPFDCTAGLTSHVVESLGEPNETFFLDVTATDGVRWAVTLARASLDGS